MDWSLLGNRGELELTCIFLACDRLKPGALLSPVPLSDSLMQPQYAMMKFMFSTGNNGIPFEAII